MKFIKSSLIFLGVLIAMSLACCSDEGHNGLPQDEDKPVDDVPQESLSYLEKYDVLKSYVNRE